MGGDPSNEGGMILKWGSWYPFTDYEWDWKYQIQYSDATHKTDYNWNYLQTPKLV